MGVLYVTRPGAEIRKKGSRLRVEQHGQVIAGMPMREVERVVLLGPVHLSAAAVRLLLRSRIPVLFCTQSGRWHGTLCSGADDVELLLAQAALIREESFRLASARAVVTTKIRHQQRLLRRHARNHPDQVLTGVCDQLGELLPGLERCDSIAALMGMEGRASALYFSVLGRCLRREGVSFSRRTRRPPTDPVNAALSLGYMLVLQEVVTSILAHGLHPGLGFLHEVSSRRPALALDLLELARQPIVDRLTLSLFNRGVLSAGDFDSRADGSVQFADHGLKRYLVVYERVMRTEFRYGSPERRGTFRDWLRENVQMLKAAIVAPQRWAPLALEL